MLSLKAMRNGTAGGPIKTPKESPWYHVLPDGEEHTTYVAERNLVGDDSTDDIEHPLLDTFFDDVTEAGYVSYEKLN